MRNTFSQEEIAWLKENYPRNESREETYARYIEAFGPKRTLCGVVTFCKRHHIRKPDRRFQTGNIPWDAGLTKSQHKSHFTPESYAKMTDVHKRNFKRVLIRDELNVPKGYVVHDLGDGEKLVMREDIWKCMLTAGLLGQGELTKTAYETYLVKRRVEKITGKSVRRPSERNEPEYMREMRKKALEKRRVAIIAEKDGIILSFASLREASRKLGICDSLISRTLNGKRKHAHGWRFEKGGR